MKIDMKKFLLAGTAIVAVSAFSAQASAADITLTGNATWGTAANGMVATPTAGDNVIVATHTLTLDGSQDDINPGAITSASTGSVVITNADDSADVAYTIGSITITGAGNITQSLTDVTTRDIASTITGNVSTGGNLVLTNVEPDAPATNAMSIGGTLTVTGTTGITAGDAAGASTTTLDVNGNATFTGAVTVTGGDNDAAADATLTLSGATNTFTGGLVLTDGAAGDAFFVLDGTAAQTVAGVISGDGDINVTNTHASGVTFSGDSTNTGTLTVNNNGNNQAVTFTGNSASAIVLGDNVGADTVTANFNGTTLAISGGVTGGGSTVSNVNILGGSTVNATTVAWTAIDTLAVSGSTIFDADIAITATNTTVASGSTLDIGAANYTSAIANAGTIILSGAGDIIGAVTGAGLLDVNASTAFNGALTQGTADIAAFTLTQTTASGWTVGTTNFSGAGTLALLGGSQTVTGNFTNTTAGQGTITISNVAGTTAIVGDIGESAADELLAFNILGATGQTVTTTGDIFAATMAINDADTLQFLGNAAQTVSSDITDGIITVGNGTTTSDVTFSGTLASLASGTSSAGAIARFNGNATFTGAYTNTGTSYVGVGAVLTSDAHSNAGSYILNANDANLTLATADFGSLTDSGGNGVLTGSAADRLIINVTGQMSAGTVVLLTGINAGAATLEDNSLQYTFVTANAGADTNVTVTAATVASLGTSTPGNASVGAVLDTLTASTDPQILAILANVASAPTQAALDEVLEATQPALDGGALAGTLNVVSNTMGMTSTRLAALRTGETETGMAAGNISKGTRMWAQGFGQSATQDFRDGIDGYDADTYGVAVGVDSENLSNGVVGLAFSYGNTAVESDNATSTDTEVDSYQVTLYGDYDLDQDTFLNGMVAYGYSNADTTRHNVGGIAGATANGDYNANTYTVRAEGGRDYAYNGMTLTPNVMGHWTHYSADSYSETGTAGGAALRNVDMDSMNIAELGVGVDASWLLKRSNGAMMEPSIGVGYRYDFIGDQVQTTAAFVGGGTAFASEGADPAQSTFDVGAALNYHTTDNWQFTVNYDFEYKSDYDAHSGYVRAAYKF